MGTPSGGAVGTGAGGDVSVGTIGKVWDFLAALLVDLK